MKYLAVLAALAVVFSSGAALAQENDSAFQEIELPRYWQGGAVTRPGNEAVDFCFATALYEDDLLVFASLDVRNDWMITFTQPAWRIEPDTDVDLRLRFNGTNWSDASGRVVAPRSIAVVADDDGQFIADFRRRNRMDLDAQGKRYELPLVGTTAMTNALRECVASRTPDGFDPRSTDVANAQLVGTAIYVAESGELLTNEHVVAGCDAVHVVPRTGDPLQVTIAATDEEKDLALLATEAPVAPSAVARFRAGQALRYGEQIAVFGYPLAGTLSAGGNFVLGNVTALSGLNDDSEMVQISAPVQPGNSGGPLLDRSGLMVGVVTSKIDDASVMLATGAVPQNVNFAIKRQAVISFLVQNGVNFTTGAPADAVDPTDIADAAVSVSAQVACNVTDPYKDFSRLP